jgi:glutaminyl-peptide cyclotransferase
MVAACLRAGSREEPDPTPAPEATSTSYGYTVVHAYPHDPQAFTQGLIFRDGDLIESTGQVGASSLRRVRVETGDIVQRVAIDAPHFAEGLTDWHDTLVQLTYTSQVGFVYDARSLSRLRTFRYTG